MTDKIDIKLNINGRDHAIRVEPRKTLVDAIREDCGLTGTHIGCEHGVCGACTVIVDGEAVRSCLMFAVQAQGKPIRTVEGLARRQDAASAAARLHRASRAAMRLLHAGLPDAGRQYAGEKSRDRRRGAARRAVVEPLPLHRLQNIVKAVRAARDEMQPAQVAPVTDAPQIAMRLTKSQPLRLDAGAVRDKVAAALLPSDRLPRFRHHVLRRRVELRDQLVERRRRSPD